MKFIEWKDIKGFQWLVRDHLLVHLTQRVRRGWWNFFDIIIQKRIQLTKNFIYTNLLNKWNKYNIHHSLQIVMISNEYERLYK